MREGRKINTSQITPYTYLEAFKEDIEAGNQIICFVMAKGISGTYNSACKARDIINKEQGKEMVYIVDSATAGFGEGMQAIHASELVKKGLDFIDPFKMNLILKKLMNFANTADTLPLLIKYLISPTVNSLRTLYLNFSHS